VTPINAKTAKVRMRYQFKIDGDMRKASERALREPARIAAPTLYATTIIGGMV
jgi:hypothetical protein